MTVQMALHAREVEVCYEDDPALTIPELVLSGNIVAVIGHNGAGKSTLLKALLGLLPLAHGELWCGVRSNSGEYRLLPERDMAFCPETGSVFADITVQSYVELWCRIKYSQADYYKRAGAAVFDLLDISPLLSKLGRELSKGQRRRVQTAIGFLLEPKLFLFDEPFDGLDVQRTSELTEIIERRVEHTAFVISSHRMDVVERIADTVLVLAHGRIVACGSVADVARTLAPLCVRISGVEHPQLESTAKSLLPNALVTRVGDESLLLADTGSSIETLRAALPAAQISNMDPSLIDAVNVHLRGLQKI
jgi:ABC-2 type transport system ATP-binding protein